MMPVNRYRVLQDNTVELILLTHAARSLYVTSLEPKQNDVYLGALHILYVFLGIVYIIKHIYLANLSFHNIHYSRYLYLQLAYTTNWHQKYSQ